MTTEITNQETDIRCPCGAVEPVAEVFATPSRQYVRCPTCDLVFLHPRPTRESVEGYFREVYDGDYGAVEASDDRQPVYQSVLKHVALYRSPPGSVLDVGCGDGGFLLLCRQAGWNCSGIELSKPAAMRAAQKGITVLSPHALERGEWAQHFDVVTLVNVLETVADPVIMLGQATALLAPGGLVIVRATNGLFHLPMWMPARWIGSQYDQAFHWYLYTTVSLYHQGLEDPHGTGRPQDHQSAQFQTESRAAVTRASLAQPIEVDRQSQPVVATCSDPVLRHGRPHCVRTVV